MKQNEFDALVILNFNIGSENFGKSSLKNMINDPNTSNTNYKTLEDAWKAFHRANGEPHKLDDRRDAEWRLYKDSDYSGYKK